MRRREFVHARRGAFDARLLTAAAAAATACVAAFVDLLPTARDGSVSAPLHLVLESTTCVTALLAVLILSSQSRRGGTLAEAALVGGFVVLAGRSLLGVVTAVAPDARFLGWAVLGGSAVGASLLALSSMLPRRRLRLRRLRAPRVAVAVAVAYGTAFTGLGLSRADLPPGAGLLDSAEPQLRLTGNAVAVALQSFSAAMLVVAAVGFSIQAVGSENTLRRWLGPTAVLGAAGRIAYLVFLASGHGGHWVVLGDLYRSASYAVLFVAAGAEVWGYANRLEPARVLEERRRVAGDLHDGMAQEIAFVLQRTRLTAGDPELEAAAQRALDETRRVMAVLTEPIDEPLETTLAGVAGQVAGRHGVRLELDIAPGIDVDRETRETLVRVVREAIESAGRHGRASRVDLECRREHGLVLRLADDGAGVAPGCARPGFALERLSAAVAALGGRLELRPRLPGGVEVEVVLP